MTEVNFQDAISRGNYSASGVQYTRDGSDHLIVSVTLTPYKRVSGWGWSKCVWGEPQTFKYDHPQFSEMADKGLQVGLHSDVIEVNEEILEDYTRCVLSSKITNPMEFIRKAIRVIDARKERQARKAAERQARKAVQSRLDELGIDIQL